MPRLRILTWHVHGNYLYYLSQVPHDFFLPVKEGLPEGYGGRRGILPWPDNVHEVPAEEVCHRDFDCILFQSHKNYLEDQYEILSEPQRSLPRVFLEHDPPRKHPTENPHPVDDPHTLLVHVTSFNELMWDNRRTPTRVINHGVLVPEDVEYTGKIERGLVVVNNLSKRGRRLGLDVFRKVRQKVPLDLVGMGSRELGGLGEVPYNELPAFESRYRFLFNPIRYTSLGLSICEAMMLGMPIIGLATTELSVTVENGVSGYVDTDVDQLIERMCELLNDHKKASLLGQGALCFARQQFGIDRFIADWNEVFDLIIHSAQLAGREYLPRV